MDIAVETNVSVGSTQSTQAFFEQMLNTFNAANPLDELDENSPDDANDAFYFDKETNKMDDTPSTPSLSLPDSFLDDDAPPLSRGAAGPGPRRRLFDYASINILENRSKEATRERSKEEADAKLRAEIDRMRVLLDDRNSTFQYLNVSEGYYKELRSRSEEDLSTYELACLRAAECLLPTKRDLEETRRAFENYQRDTLAKQTELETERIALHRECKLNTVTIESQRLELEAAEQRYQRLKTLLDVETAGRRACEDKAARTDKVIEENNKLLTELSTLRHTLEEQGILLRSLGESEKAAKTQAQEATRTSELLAQDKSYLQSEVRNAESRVEERARAAEAATSKAIALEIKVAQLSDQLISMQLNARTAFDERMESELARLREDSQRDIENLRQSSREIADRENRVLREAKSSLETELVHLRRRLDSLAVENNQLTRELTETATAKNQEISHLSAELKMKTFELTALGTTFEERTALLRRAQMESDLHKEELFAHKSALVKLEAESGKRVQALTLQLENVEAQLKSYELLELEIDDAVIRAGSEASDELAVPLPGASAGTAGTAGGSFQASGELLRSVRHIPSAPERRVRQAVYLAQRLLETEKQRDELRMQLQAADKSVSEWRKRAEDGELALERAAQPTAYLVGKLRDEEDARAAAMAQRNTLEHQLRVCESAVQAKSAEAKQLRERMQAILQQRAELDALKDLVEDWRRAQQQQQQLQEREDDYRSSDEDDGDDDSGDEDDYEDDDEDDHGNGGGDNGDEGYDDTAEAEAVADFGAGAGDSGAPPTATPASNSASASAPVSSTAVGTVSSVAAGGGGGAFLLHGLSPDVIRRLTTPPSSSVLHSNKKIQSYSPRLALPPPQSPSTPAAATASVSPAMGLHKREVLGTVTCT